MQTTTAWSLPSHVTLRAVLNLAAVSQAAVPAKVEPFESEIVLIIRDARVFSSACICSRILVLVIFFLFIDLSLVSVFLHPFCFSDSCLF